MEKIFFIFFSFVLSCVSFGGNGLVVCRVILLGLILIGYIFVWKFLFYVICCLLLWVVICVWFERLFRKVRWLFLVWNFSRLKLYNCFSSLLCGGKVLKIFGVGNGICRKKLIWLFMLCLCSLLVNGNRW